MTFDGNNRLIVVDPFDFSLSVVDPKDGKIVKKYGKYGAEDGQLSYPSSVTYDAGTRLVRGRRQREQPGPDAPDSRTRGLGRHGGSRRR